MSDREVRDAERGLVENPAVALLVRLRAGRLKRERLWLAAYLGHPPAVEALGEQLAAPTIGAGGDVETELLQWLSGIRTAGDEALIRVAMAAAERVAPRFQGGLGGRDRDMAHACLHATRDWLRCPCAAHRRVVSRERVQRTQQLLPG